MGIFKKQPKVDVCDMCGKADVEGCGSSFKHVEQITQDQPTWLPAHLRGQAVGEYTWLCLHCNWYPAMKWPTDGAASAGMTIHLGASHYLGPMKDMGNPPFSMIPAD